MMKRTLQAAFIYGRAEGRPMIGIGGPTLGRSGTGIVGTGIAGAVGAPPGALGRSSGMVMPVAAVGAVTTGTEARTAFGVDSGRPAA